MREGDGGEAQSQTARRHARQSLAPGIGPESRTGGAGRGVGAALGFRLYRTVSLGKGIRLYATKTGVGVSVGPRGLKYHVHSSGRHGYSAGLPGTGMYYRQDRRSWRSNATKSGGGGV